MPNRVLVEGVASKKHPLYGTWSNMRDRCNNPNNKDYRYYGARGIQVCPEWGSFYQFVEDIRPLGPRPDGHTLDRIDPRADYRQDNVRWATHREQAQNQRELRCTNQTGVRGVNQDKNGGYIARITHRGVRHYVGYFQTLEDAANAIDDTIEELNRAHAE